MRNLIALLIIPCFVMLRFVYAAPVDVPTKIQGLEGNVFKNKELGIGLSIASEADFLSKRKLDTADNGGIAEIKARFYTTKIILTVVDKFDIYGIFGKADNLEYKEDESIKFKPKDKLAWGVGLSMPIYKWERYGIDLFADGKYRAVNNINYGTNYAPQSPGIIGPIRGISYTAPRTSVDWQEWQVAFGVAKKFKYFMSYLGVKYSDFRESSKTKSDSIVGIFIGCSVAPIKALSIDLQGRFIDESAFTVKATYKF